MNSKMRQTVHSALESIDEETLKRISEYKGTDVTVESFKEKSTWSDLKDILLSHPLCVTRHEASFIIGKLQIQALFQYLFIAVENETSIIAAHEAVAALGDFNGELAREAYAFLRQITDPKNRKSYGEIVYHPEVQETAKSSMQELEEKL